MMFTLDEEDDETEYGESFKSSIRSGTLKQTFGNQATAGFGGMGGAYKRNVSSSDEEDEDDDLNPDMKQTLAFKQEKRRDEFSDEQTIYNGRDLSKQELLAKTNQAHL